MVGMPVLCVLCGTNKNRTLMQSSDTCHECAEEFRLCAECNKSTVAKSWRDCLCPLCGQSATTAGTAVGISTRTASVSGINSKPPIISTLSILGWVLFAIMGLGGLFLLNQDGGEILAVSLIVAGVLQLSIFLGFSAIIDQLHQINLNTSISDEDK